MSRKPRFESPRAAGGKKMPVDALCHMAPRVRTTPQKPTRPLPKPQNCVNSIPEAFADALPRPCAKAAGEGTRPTARHSHTKPRTATVLGAVGAFGRQSLSLLALEGILPACWDPNLLRASAPQRTPYENGRRAVPACRRTTCYNASFMGPMGRTLSMKSWPQDI